MTLDLSISLRVCAPRAPVKPDHVPARMRSGGKPAARKLRKPIKDQSKRAAFLRWFLEDDTGRTVGACMSHFSLSRQNVITYWTTIQREHGIGYTIAANTITPILPAKCDADSIFKAVR